MLTDPHVARRRFVLLTALRWLGTGPLAPVLVLLLQDRGLSLTRIGFLLAVYSGTTVVLELPTGGLADTLGARPVLAAATVANLIAVAGLLVADPVPALLYGVAVLLGIGRALASGPLEAWYVNTVRAVDPTADIRTGLARAGVAEALALGCGALLAGVAGRFLSEPLGTDPLTVPVVASLLATAVFLAALLLLLDPAPRPEPAASAGRLRREFARTPAVVRRGLALVVHAPELRRLLVAMAAGCVPLVVTETLWQPRIAAITGDAAPTLLLGVLGAGSFAAAAAGSALAPAVGRRAGVRTGRAVVLVVAGQAVSQLALAVTGHVLAFAAAFLVAYLANGVWSPLHGELTHDRVNEDERATVVSGMSMAMHLTGIAAMLTLIPMAGATSPAVAWVLAGALSVVGVLAVLGLQTQPPAPVPVRVRT